MAQKKRANRLITAVAMCYLQEMAGALQFLVFIELVEGTAVQDLGNALFILHEFTWYCSRCNVGRKHH